MENEMKNLDDLQAKEVSGGVHDLPCPLNVTNVKGVCKYCGKSFEKEVDMSNFADYHYQIIMLKGNCCGSSECLNKANLENGFLAK